MRLLHSGWDNLGHPNFVNHVTNHLSEITHVSSSYKFTSFKLLTPPRLYTKTVSTEAMCVSMYLLHPYI